ncbi:2-oxo-4-hydroxy-4-carboxy-5-ureidoimidazoline decarboxylase [Catenuloplanes atrovinosus]|uniref:2-oxo-4-hydroxy-4-carboxy-5-ureidoimidazoline decarboxylase n=1 Tax=Catenuloplanes atrovinosus TaxID=137266 RepID=A0AAE4C7J2_9ACTN|nr:2-oxo-4-hydroxy-4-carboxy-5-ureidoimidazoline decarboxylase [Catenuloplanes atrovinosus]MDR7273943.1 2-oxo-4-hydroxy-4-carboxy-5-ureidoimidazoline decarboxylase [Catenuloplanes atrovinosus]
MTLAELNALPEEAAREELRTCCASSRWVSEVAARRPYPRLDALLAVSDAALAVLGWDDVLEALAAHPRIGQRVTGADRESAWSRREQSGMDAATDDVRAALAEANAAYEERFGHVFLIFASGRSDVEMLAAARSRLDNDEPTERRVVHGELTRIVRLRLERLFG